MLQALFYEKYILITSKTYEKLGGIVFAEDCWTKPALNTMLALEAQGNEATQISLSPHTLDLGCQKMDIFGCNSCPRNGPIFYRNNSYFC